MKRTILSILIGLTATTGAMADNNDTGFETCLRNFYNDPNVLQMINDGITGSKFEGLAKLTGNTEDEVLKKFAALGQVSDDREAFWRVLAGSMFAYVGEHCPEYFVGFGKYITQADSISLPMDDIALHLVWETNHFKAVDAETYKKHTTSTKMTTYVPLHRLTGALTATYYPLILPCDATGASLKTGEWLTYDNAMNALSKTKPQCLKTSWTTTYSPISNNNPTDEEHKERLENLTKAITLNNILGLKHDDQYTQATFIDGAGFINLNPSFPGLLIDMDNSTMAIRTLKHEGETFYLIQNGDVRKSPALNFAVTEIQTLSETLYNTNCDDTMCLYLASTESPVSIAAKFVEKYSVDDIQDETEENKHRDRVGVSAIVIGGTVATAGVMWGILKATGWTASQIGLKTTGAVVSKVASSAFFQWAGTAAIPLLVGTAGLGVAYMFLDELVKIDQSPVDISTYDRLFVLSKFPLKNRSLQNQKAIHTAPAQSSSFGGNTDTPAESDETMRISDGW